MVAYSCKGQAPLRLLRDPLSSVAYPIALSLILLSSERSLAKTATVDDLVSSESLYWLAIASITFVQGAANGLFSLLLRRYRFRYSGYRWTEGFWSGFPIALLTAILVDGLTRPTTLTSTSTSLWIAAYLCLNGAGMYIVSQWAARE